MSSFIYSFIEATTLALLGAALVLLISDRYGPKWYIKKIFSKNMRLSLHQACTAVLSWIDISTEVYIVNHTAKEYIRISGHNRVMDYMLSEGRFGLNDDVELVDASYVGLDADVAVEGNGCDDYNLVVWDQVLFAEEGAGQN